MLFCRIKGGLPCSISLQRHQETYRQKLKLIEKEVHDLYICYIRSKNEYETNFF